MKHAITVIEMRGFAAMSTALARDMERVALTPERIRAGVIRMVDAILEDCRSRVPTIRAAHIGGDSWFIESATLADAIHFGISFLKIIEMKGTQGLYYLKPSLATGIGEPRLLDGKFLDDESIETYRAADSGKPFRYELTGEAVNVARQHDWIVLSDEASEERTLTTVEWRSSVPPDAEPIPAFEITLPKLLLDSEVLYSSSPTEALLTIQQQQSAANTIHAFGGPVPLNIPMYRAYVKSAIALVREQTGPSFVVLSYIPLNEAEASFAWLELCRRLNIQYDTRFSFRAFGIPEGQLRPFSFQVFDEDTVHLGLRSYSPQKGTPTMSSAVMFRNREIAARFLGEFIENWRSLDEFSEDSFGILQKNLQGLTPTARKAAMKDVDELLRGV